MKSVSVVTVRGHTSRTGECNIIRDVTGRVIDVAVLSSYCKGCEKWRGPKSLHSYEEWKLKHQPHCVKNRIGSSSKMEVDGMRKYFKTRCHNELQNMLSISAMGHKNLPSASKDSTIFYRKS
ncbi:uncharacterized protein TNCV_4437561 [Trichonephila clavipes]|nr:uncharacterized protein TNCV_4437561 [Trichonephila clavipes]